MTISSKPADKWFLAAVLIIGILMWSLHANWFIADDSCFYLVVARNVALNGVQTFSSITPTNGVHPLWTYLLSGYSYLLILNSGALNYLACIVPLSAALLIGGVIILWRTGTLLNVHPFSLVIIPSVFLLGLGVLGSEAIVHFFSISMLLFVCSFFKEWTLWRCFAAGLISASVILSRLDSVFVVAGFFLWHLFFFKKLSRTLTIIVACSLIMIPYLLYNYVIFGSIMPISGWLKGTFPEPSFKGFTAWGTMTNIGGYNLWFGVLPIVIGLLSVPFRNRMSPNQWGAVFILLVGSCLQFIYISVFTDGDTLWHWYYVVPITLFSLVVNIFMVHCCNYLNLSISKISYAVVVVAVFGLGLIYHKKYLDVVTWPNAAWYKAIKYVKDHNIKDQTILVSDWPGNLAFFSKDNRILAADMLTSNRLFYDRMISSGNALKFLMVECERQEKPIRYIFYTGNTWIVPNAAKNELVYNSPRGNSRNKIGELSLPKGTNCFQDGVDFIVWELPRR